MPHRSEPFGVWIADVESRITGGVAALIRVFDENDQQIGNDLQLTSSEAWFTDQNITEADCGGSQRGCGNRTTRFIGFVTSPDMPLSKILIAVGDSESDMSALDVNQLALIGPSIATDFSCAMTDLRLLLPEISGGIMVGEPFTFSAIVTNAGANAATQVSTTIELDAGVTIQSAVSESGAVCTENGNTAECLLAVLASGEVEELRITAQADAAGSIEISGEVESAETDAVLANNNRMIPVVV